MRRQHVIITLIMAFFLVNCSSNNVGVFEKIEKSTMEKTIDKYMGTPYQWGGNTPGKGVDCSGLTYSLYKSQEVDLPRVSRLQYAVGDGVSRNKLKYGDLVFFDTLGKGVSHVGMYVGDNKMVHASSSKGVTQTPIDTDYWRKRYIGARRIVGSPLASGETSVERHILAASYPMTIRRLVDIPTTDIIDNSFFGLDVQTDVNGNLRLGSSISFWNFLEFGVEGQINQFLGHGSLGLEIPFVSTKIKFWEQGSWYPSFAMGAESNSQQWIVETQTPDSLGTLWSPEKSAYLVTGWQYSHTPWFDLGKGRLNVGIAATDLWDYQDKDAGWDQWSDVYGFVGIEQQLLRRVLWMIELDHLGLGNRGNTLNTGFRVALNEETSIEYTFMNIGHRDRDMVRAMRFSYFLDF